VPANYTGVAFNPGYGAYNHAFGFGYDGGSGYNGGDGNVTNDGNNTYIYSLYGRPVTVNSTTAVYDALGRLVEVQPSSGNKTQIVYAPDGWKFAYMNGQTVEKYVAPMAGGVQVVYTAATPAQWAYYRHADWLGSERLASTLNRGVQYGGAYAPFGESYAETGTSDRSFTGQTQDVASGLYDFPFRQYSAAQGRWLVPDPAGRAAVDITNPQTWNRYAYLANNPLNAVDPLGLFCEVDYSGDSSGCALGSPDGGGGGGGGGAGLISGSNLAAAVAAANAWSPVTIQASGYTTNGATYQINDQGQWYNTSSGEELTQSSVEELGLPDPSALSGGSASLFGGNPANPNSPTSIYNKFRTRGYPDTTPTRNPGPIRPGEPNIAPARNPVPPPPVWLKLWQDTLDFIFGGGQGTFFDAPILFVNPCNSPGAGVDPVCQTLTPGQPI